MINKLFKMFVGEYVSVTIKVYLMESKDTEQQAYSFQVPMVKEGYLLEEDSFSYYFGITPDEVAFAIKKKDVSIIEIATTELTVVDPLMDLLNKMKPSKEEDFN